jgi:hypothetical protein
MSKTIETIAEQLYTHHKDAMSRSISGKSCLLFGIYPQTWRQLKGILELYNSPVKLDGVEETTVTLGALRNKLKSYV